MTVKQMEEKLLALQDRFKVTKEPAVQAEYKALHARWVEAKGGS